MEHINQLVLEAMLSPQEPVLSVDSLSLARRQKTNKLQSAANINNAGSTVPAQFQKKIKDIKINMMQRS